MSDALTELPDDVRALVERVHATPTVAVVAVSGAGAAALAWLLAVPGASRTLLEGRVPYARSAFVEWLGAEPAEFVSRETAIAMARAARTRARALQPLDHADAPAVGLACTATIATDRVKRGEHRCWIGVASSTGVTTYGLRLEKGARDRGGEEAVVSRLALQALAVGCGVEGFAHGPASLALRASERVETRHVPA